jgi:hypothetical protein
MNIDPEDLQQLFKATYAEWKRDADTAPLTVILPDEVVKRLNTLGVPSWKWLKEGLERIYSDYRLEETLGEDMASLLKDEDAFEWPLDDPLYCFVLGVMRDYSKRALGKLLEEDDGDDDEADWWKSPS